MVSLRKLASARVPLEGLRACPAHPLGWFPLRKLASAWAPLKRLRACPAHPLGWFPLGSWRVPGPPLRGSGRILDIP
ncbi:unnamed protein product [Prunus armeniaca]